MNNWIQVVQHLQPGGIETMALDLQKHSESNDCCFIVALEGEREQTLKNWPRLAQHADRLIFLEKKPGIDLKALFRLVKLLRWFKPKSVHTHHIGPLIYGGIAARLAGIANLVHTEHDAWHLRDSKRRKLQKWIVRLVNPLLVADAGVVARDLQHWLSLDKRPVEIIRNGINTQKFKPGDQRQARQKLNLPKGVDLIGCAGRLSPEKGHKVMLEALKYLDPSVHLALAGDGAERSNLQQQAELLGIEDRVHFLGALDCMPTFYQSLDLFCLPSFFEGLSLVILEAQACDIPALVTHVGASHEALCPHTGALVEPGAPFAMAKELREMLKTRQTVSPRSFVKQCGDLQNTIRHYAALRQTFS